MLSPNGELVREEVIFGPCNQEYAYVLDEELSEDEARVIVEELENNGIDAYYVFEDYTVDDKVVEYIVIYKF